MCNQCAILPPTNHSVKVKYLPCYSGTMLYNLKCCFLIQPPHDITYKMTCAPSEDSDQPGHLPCLIRVLAVRSMGSWGPKLSSCGWQRFWSDWADARLICLCRVHMPFCLFCHEVVVRMVNIRTDRSGKAVSTQSEQGLHCCCSICTDAVLTVW